MTDLVIFSPEGLYVSSGTPQGFEVHETARQPLHYRFRLPHRDQARGLRKCSPRRPHRTIQQTRSPPPEDAASGAALRCAAVCPGNASTTTPGYGATHDCSAQVGAWADDVFAETEGTRAPSLAPSSAFCEVMLLRSGRCRSTVVKRKCSTIIRRGCRTFRPTANGSQPATNLRRASRDCSSFPSKAARRSRP
jgi:hypothetical protein